MGSACRTTPYVGEVQQHYDVPLGEGEALVGSVMTGWGGPEGPGVRSLAEAGWETAGLWMPSGSSGSMWTAMTGRASIAVTPPWTAGCGRLRSMLLGIAAGLALGAESPISDRSALTIALNVALSASTVAVPIVCTLVSPLSMEPRLVTWRARLSRSGLKVTASVMMMIGLVLVAVGWSQR